MSGTLAAMTSHGADIPLADTITDTAKYKIGWVGGLPETPCGHGSKLSSTKMQRAWIPQIVEKYAIKSIADIGAGDLNWVGSMALPAGVTYTAYDLVPRKTTITKFDIVNEIPPRVDLLMCLWVLNHFPIDHCIQAIENLKLSGSRYLMMTYRQRYAAGSPKDLISMIDGAVERLVLNDKQDQIVLVAL